MSIWIQLTSGRGPAECGRAVYLGTQCLLKELTKMGVEAEVLQAVEDGEKHTFKSAVISLKGKVSDEVLAYVKSWCGSIQWICPSPFRPKHKRKNWFFGVELFEPPESIHCLGCDVRIESFRASGPGGQHVNTTDSAIRVTHVPTGLAATASEERSQAMNRKLAMARLLKLIEQSNQGRVKAHEKECWDSHNSLERGNPVKVFKGEKFRG